MAPTRVCLGILILALFALPALAQDLGPPDLETMLSLQNDYGWGPVFGWPPNSNPCPATGDPWNGVSCFNGRVDSIDVTCGGILINQPTPPILGQLSAARHISVRKCNLWGPNGATVISFKVMMGSLSYEFIGSTRTRLPWTTITGIQVTFSASILNANINSLSGITANSFYGLGTDTLTWSFASPLPAGLFSTSLLGTGQNAITDYGGIPIAAFNRTFKVLPGDYNDDGNVNSLDLVGVNNARSLAYNILADIDANGRVDLNDVTLVRNRVGTSLP